MSVLIDEIIRQMIEQQKRENEKKIFEQKIADGTLVPEKEIQKLIEQTEQVLFCNSATRDKILRDIGELPNIKFVVSNLIEDGIVYMVPDKETRERILLSFD